MVSVAVLGTWGYGWWTVGNADQGTVTTNVISQEVQDQRVPLDGAVDMLLVGMDSRTDAYGNPLPREVLDMLHAGKSDGEQNTDTMILVHIPVDGTRAVAISFPRDSWVELAGGFGKHRLNSAFAYAYNNAHDELGKTAPDEKTLDEQAKVEGRKNLIATIEKLVGGSVTIDRYAEVNLLSFYDITNAIGGVDVCLKAATRDPLSGADFPAGRQTLTGAQALAFVRQRHQLPNGDLDRIVRQQVFLGALANKVLSADMLTSPSRVHDLISAVQRSVILSSGWQLSTFASQMSGLTAGGIDFYTIPVVGEAKIGGADVLKVDPDQVASFVSSLTADNSGKPESSSQQPRPETPGPTTTTTPTTAGGDRPALGTITVDVQNGSNIKGMAATVRQQVIDDGFRGGVIGDAPTVRSTSLIQYGPGARNVAEYLAQQLGGQFTLQQDGTLSDDHLMVVVGTGYSAPGQTTNGLRAQPPSEPGSSEPSGSTAPSTKPTPQINASGLNCVN